MRYRATADPMKPAPPVIRNRLDIISLHSATVRQTRQKSKFPIFVRKHDLPGTDRPVDVELRIAPSKTSPPLGGVVIIYLVGDFSVWLQRADRARRAKTSALIRRQRTCFLLKVQPASGPKGSRVNVSKYIVRGFLKLRCAVTPSSRQCGTSRVHGIRFASIACRRNVIEVSSAHPRGRLNIAISCPKQQMLARTRDCQIPLFPRQG